jgi:hypothetical protein
VRELKDKAHASCRVGHLPDLATVEEADVVRVASLGVIRDLAHAAFAGVEDFGLTEREHGIS